MLRKLRSIFTRNNESSRKDFLAKHTMAGQSGWCANLSLEHLESRVVLSSNPILLTPSNLVADEGVALNLSDIGVFSDKVLGSGDTIIGLDPDDYTSLGAFDPTANVVFDTDALTIDGSTVVATKVSLDAGNGAYDVAVFAFDSFELDAGLTLIGTGSLPLVILSQSDLDVSGIIDVSATVESASAGPAEGQRIAGPGGGGGGRATSSPIVLDGSAAPGAPIVLGFQGFGRGFGTGIRGGGGGAFGGDGGEGIPTGPGKKGFAYGDLSLGIQGGSGGGAVGLGTNRVDGGGGGGGIELGANGTVTINGSVLANGGYSGSSTLYNGGGGGGGGILIHAYDVDVSGAVLSANGGASDNFPGNTSAGDEGGAGGGGRILISHDSTGSYTDTGSTITVDAGQDGGAYTEAVAEAGVFSVIPVTSTPDIETYDYSIDWGDLTATDTGVSALDVVGGLGEENVGSFDGSHTYANEGVYAVTVTVNDSGGGTATDTFDVTVYKVFTVDSVLDIVDDNLGDGIAEDASGNTTLRAAIQEANALGVPTKIILPEGNYNLTLSGGESINFANASVNDLDITGDITIVGVGAGLSVIDASGLTRNIHSRAFEVWSDGSLELSGLTVTGADVTASGGAAWVQDDAHLTLRQAALAGNKAAGVGGGIHFDSSASGEIIDSVITDNDAAVLTGGVFATDGTPAISVAGSVIAGNRDGAANNDLADMIAAAGRTFSSGGNNLIGMGALSSGDGFDFGGALGDVQGSPDYVVTSVDDRIDSADDSYAISLREAVFQANSISNTSGDDEIWLAPWFFVLTEENKSSDEDFAITGDLDIRENLTIRSAGGATIDATQINDDVFEEIGSAILTLVGITEND